MLQLHICTKKKQKKGKSIFIKKKKKRNHASKVTSAEHVAPLLVFYSAESKTLMLLKINNKMSKIWLICSKKKKKKKVSVWSASSPALTRSGFYEPLPAAVGGSWTTKQAEPQKYRKIHRRGTSTKHVPYWSWETSSLTERSGLNRLAKQRKGRFGGCSHLAPLN